MRRLELVLGLGLLLSVGCSDSDRPGEKGALTLRFGLGGCASVPLSEAGLARGGETELEVGDDEKRTTLTAATEAEDVVAIAGPRTFELKCPEAECEQTSGKVLLNAVKEGQARLTFSSGDALVDAVTVQVREPVRLVIIDEDEDSEDLRTEVGTPIELTARLLDSNSGVVVATRPFTWQVEGAALAATKSDTSHVTLDALSAGISTVSVTFKELTAKVQVAVEQ